MENEKDRKDRYDAYYDISDDLLTIITKIRKQQNLSQSELGEITGNNQGVISRIEGRKTSPTFLTVCGLVDALGYKIEIVPKDSDVTGTEIDFNDNIDFNKIVYESLKNADFKTDTDVFEDNEQYVLESINDDDCMEMKVLEAPKQVEDIINKEVGSTDICAKCKYYKITYPKNRCSNQETDYHNVEADFSCDFFESNKYY